MSALFTPPVGWTGRMPRVCGRCGDKYGDKPCSPEMDGQVTHGICPACAPAELARVLAEVQFSCRPGIGQAVSCTVSSATPLERQRTLFFPEREGSQP